MTKHPIALHLGWQECKNYLLLHLAFTFTLDCSVFPIQSLDVCSKNEVNELRVCAKLCGANAAGTVHVFSMKKASA